MDQFENYGQLSGRQIEDLKVGVRIDANENKKHPLDFALWKSVKTKESDVSGAVWKSPWGEGRPGWHIECSAMVKGIFGDSIDIHGGGLDLIFPHHENEIAQSESCNGHKYVNHWMHVNMIQMSGSKMSKSLGNVITMREFLSHQSAEVYKWLMLSTHYRSVTDFSEVTLQNAIAGLARVYSSLALAQSLQFTEQATDLNYQKELDLAWKQMSDFINDDFSTPQAFAVMFEQIRKFNSMFRRGMKSNPTVAGKAKLFTEFILKWGRLLSLFQNEPVQFLKELDQKLMDKMNIDPLLVQKLVDERTAARAEKNFALSDQIRQKLTDLKITVSDLPDGSFWEVMK